MFNIILFQPEIPPNTGNIMRLAANTGCRLHLVRPLGFQISDKRLERAGMDYRVGVDYQLHASWPECRQALAGSTIHAVTSKGRQRYDQARFRPGDAFVFGSESAGLPAFVLEDAGSMLRLPMLAGNRSLNLANAVAITVYEAWRQTGFHGGI